MVHLFNFLKSGQTIDETINFFSGHTTTKTTDNLDATNLLLRPTKTPTRIFGPLIAYTNPETKNTTKTNTPDLQNLHPDDLLHIHKKPIVPPEENPYYHQKGPDLQNVETFVTTTPKPKITTKYKTKEQQQQQKRKPIFGMTSSPHEELLHILGQHPQFANIPHGSIVEVHNVPTNHPAFLDHFLRGVQQQQQHATTYNNNLTVYPGGL